MQFIKKKLLHDKFEYFLKLFYAFFLIIFGQILLRILKFQIISFSGYYKIFPKLLHLKIVFYKK